LKVAVNPACGGIRVQPGELSQEWGNIKLFLNELEVGVYNCVRCLDPRGCRVSHAALLVRPWYGWNRSPSSGRLAITVGTADVWPAEFPSCSQPNEGWSGDDRPLPIPPASYLFCLSIFLLGWDIIASIGSELLVGVDRHSCHCSAHCGKRASFGQALSGVCCLCGSNETHHTIRVLKETMRSAKRPLF
jgi:hypothetical protein